MSAAMTLAASLAMAAGAVCALLAVVWPSASKIRARELRDTLHEYSRAPQAAAGRTEQKGAAVADSRARLVDVADRLVANAGKTGSLTAALAGAAVAMRPGEWVLLRAGSIAGGAIAFGVLGGTLAGALIGAAAGALLPSAALRVRRGRRLAAFNDALPDMLSSLASGLRAGHSVEQAIEAAAATFNGPMRDELRRAVVAIQLGSTTDEALLAVAGRMRSKSLEWVALVIRLNRGVGGRMAEVLLKVAGTIREREAMRRHVKALAAEGRLSMWVLGSLPVLMFGYLVLTRPDYILPFIASPLGLAAGVTAALMVVVGVVAMARIAKVEI